VKAQVRPPPTVADTKGELDMDTAVCNQPIGRRGRAGRGTGPPLSGFGSSVRLAHCCRKPWIVRGDAGTDAWIVTDDVAYSRATFGLPDSMPDSRISRLCAPKRPRVGYCPYLHAECSRSSVTLSTIGTPSEVE
jgi:hypothetical protein